MRTHGTAYALMRAWWLCVHARLYACPLNVLNDGIANVEYEISQSRFYRSTRSTCSRYRSGEKHGAQGSRWTERRAMMYKGRRPITYVRIPFKPCKSRSSTIGPYSPFSHSVYKRIWVTSVAWETRLEKFNAALLFIVYRDCICIWDTTWCTLHGAFAYVIGCDV